MLHMTYLQLASVIAVSMIVGAAVTLCLAALDKMRDPHDTDTESL